MQNYIHIYTWFSDCPDWLDEDDADELAGRATYRNTGTVKP